MRNFMFAGEALNMLLDNVALRKAVVHLSIMGEDKETHKRVPKRVSTFAPDYMAYAIHKRLDKNPSWLYQPVIKFEIGYTRTSHELRVILVVGDLSDVAPFETELEDCHLKNEPTE